MYVRYLIVKLVLLWIRTIFWDGFLQFFHFLYHAFSMHFGCIAIVFSHWIIFIINNRKTYTFICYIVNWTYTSYCIFLLLSLCLPPSVPNSRILTWLFHFYRDFHSLSSSVSKNMFYINNWFSIFLLNTYSFSPLVITSQSTFFHLLNFVIGELREIFRCSLEWYSILFVTLFRLFSECLIALQK